jgi:hypothetical protein
LNSTPKQLWLTASIGAVAVAAFYIGRAYQNIGDCIDVASEIAANFSGKISQAADLESAALREFSSKALSRPLKSGRYYLRILGRSGEMTFLPATLEIRDGVYYLKTKGSSTEEEVSSDGVYFEWKSDGYGIDRYIGLKTGDSVFGRIFYSHGTDVGIEHFWIESFAAASSRIRNDVMTKRTMCSGESYRPVRWDLGN